MNALVQPPPAAIMHTLSRFDRRQLAGFIAVAIDLLDFADGDPDAEEIGLEDSFQTHGDDGPGCPIADAGGQTDEDELNTRGDLVMYATRNAGPAARSAMRTATSKWIASRKTMYDGAGDRRDRGAQ